VAAAQEVEIMMFFTVSIFTFIACQGCNADLSIEIARLEEII